MQMHQYKFPFPEKALRILLTLCFDVDPVLESELPYDLRVHLHKPGTNANADIRFLELSLNIQVTSGPTNMLFTEEEDTQD